MSVRLFGIILGAMLIFGAAGSAQADELNEAIRHHGYYSWQADHGRRELDRLRSQCRLR